MAAVVGVDLGGTKTAAARVDVDGQLGPIRSVSTPATAGPEAILDTVAKLVQRLIDEERDRVRGAQVLGVGVGAAGVIDAGTGTVVSATDAIRDWAGTAVADGLKARLELPVVVENDVDAHATGEAWLGAAAEASSALMVAVGTGVGGAVVFDGRALRGAHHVAGEIGHMPAQGAEGLRCPCGRSGHLEAIGSGPALHRYYLALGGEPNSPSTRDVMARAAAGETLARRAVRDSAGAVGRSIAGAVTVLDPAVVVIGGGMAEAGALWWQAMEEALRAELIDVLADLSVVPATLGGSAAIAGAARAAWDLVGR